MATETDKESEMSYDSTMPNAQDLQTRMGRIFWCATARQIQKREQYDSETGLAQRLAQEDGREEPNDLDIAAAEWVFGLQESE